MKIYEFIFQDNRVDCEGKMQNVHELYHTRRAAMKCLDFYKSVIKAYSHQFFFTQATLSTWADGRGLSIDVDKKLVKRSRGTLVTLYTELNVIETKD